MSPKTVTKPPTDKHLWRLLLARTHPDQGGDAELFIWAHALRELICGEDASGRSYGPRSYGAGSRSYTTGAERTGAEPERIPFNWSGAFDDLTNRALDVAGLAETPDVHARLLRMLADCEPAHLGPALLQQQRGATYKQLAYIAHRTGMSKEERRGWYQVAEAVSLAQRHAGHILGRLAEEGQAA